MSYLRVGGRLLPVLTIAAIVACTGQTSSSPAETDRGLQGFPIVPSTLPLGSSPSTPSPTVLPTQSASPRPTYDLTLPTLAPWTPGLASATPEVTDVDGVQWQRLGGDSLFGFDGVGVWSSGGRWLGVGGHSICPSYCVGEESWLLESPDAISWSILGQLPVTPEGLGVSETSMGYFAYGTLDGYEPGDHPAMFRSTDRASWTSQSDQPAFAPGKCGSDDRETITSMYETPSGLVAEGSATWFSADGENWQCTDQPPIHLLNLGDGYVGVRYLVPHDSLWSSDDGRNWTLLGESPDDGTVVPVAGGYLDVPYGDPRVGTYQHVHTSTDGKDWSDAGTPFKPAYVETITSDGTRAAGVDESDPAIWLSSSDGKTWTRYLVPTHSGNGYAGDELNSVTQLGQTVVVNGSGAGNRSSAALWVAQIQ